MFNSTNTVTDLGTICHQAVNRHKKSNEDFGATTNQVYFFVLVWLQKQSGFVQRLEDLLVDQDKTALIDQAGLVTSHLNEWGATVAGLQKGDSLEWELLRFQMEKAIRYASGKQDALQEALLTILQLLRKMPRLAELNGKDVPSLVIKERKRLTNIYDFRSPFYAFAKRITHNKLRDQYRQENRRRRYLVYIEEMATGIPAVQAPPSLDDELTLQHLRCLKNDLLNLLDRIDCHLSPKQQLVARHTLGARAQFGRLLQIVNLPWPESIPQNQNLSDDVEIAQVLKMNANNVRATRSQALKRLAKIDPILADLLNILLKRYGPK